MWRKITLGGRLKGEYLLFYVGEGFSALVASRGDLEKWSSMLTMSYLGRTSQAKGRARIKTPGGKTVLGEHFLQGECAYLSNANTSNVLGPSNGSSCWCVKNIGFFFSMSHGKPFWSEMWIDFHFSECALLCKELPERNVGSHLALLSTLKERTYISWDILSRMI